MLYGIKLLMPVLALLIISIAILRALFRGLMDNRAVFQALKVVALFTVVEFLSYRPVIFVATSAFALVIANIWLGSDIKARLATFWMAVIIFPPLQTALPGVGGLSHVILLDHFRIAAIVLLLPAALQLMFSKTAPRKSSLALDVLVVIYPIFRIALLFGGITLTSSLRSCVELLLDLVLPYYVMTRGIRNEEDLRFVLQNLLVACMFAAAVAYLEAAARLNIYSELQWVYGVTWSLTHTLMRGGMNRVQAMTPQPILYAVQLLFTLGLWVALATARVRRPALIIGTLLLVGAMVLTWSRGPWIGAIVFGLSFLALKKVKPSIFAALLVVFVICGITVKAMGLDAAVITALKDVFGGSQEDTGTILYRSQLLDSAIALVKQSPFLGVPDYAASMQDLKQGEGIIDIVNTYVSVALGSGLIGLALFLLPYLYMLGRIFKDLSGLESSQDRSRANFLRAFAALIVGCLVTIFTTSIGERIPFLLLFTLCAPALWLSFLPADSKGEHKAETPTPKGWHPGAALHPFAGP